jgi:hypothetical protein
LEDLPRIEEDGGRWLRRPELYKRVVEPHKKKKKTSKVWSGYVSNISLAVQHVPPLRVMG